jgi:predicted RNA-binding protein with PUA-like domain
MYICRMNYWLIKSEPFKYSWQQFVQDGVTFWDGVRNYLARNNMQAMQKGDLALFYHSNEGMEVVGIAKVVKTSYQDPTTPLPAWVAVDFKPVKALKVPVTLAQIKANDITYQSQLVKLMRLSVASFTEEEFMEVLRMGETKL